MLDRQLISNPFDSDVVEDPSVASPIDVPRIHESAFDLCQHAYERVASGMGSWSVLLNGMAGCGKTHLLSRLRRWLNSELDTVPNKPAALFVAVRMETGRGMIWRHLRRRFAEELLQPRANDVTQLQAILNRLAERAHGNLSEGFERIVAQDCGEELMQVLEAYHGNKHRRLCRAWLKGERLSENQLELLSLPQYPIENFEEDWAEEEARKFVGAVTRLAAPSPVVFCFDQIEALGLSQERVNYGFFCRMGASLVDTTRNSLLISTINLDFLGDLKSGSRDADFQRISKDQLDLQPLDFNLGRELVNARLALVPESRGATPICAPSFNRSGVTQRREALFMRRGAFLINGKVGRSRLCRRWMTFCQPSTNDCGANRWSAGSLQRPTRCWRMACRSHYNCSEETLKKNRQNLSTWQ
jgi:hypothetical protein